MNSMKGLNSSESISITSTISNVRWGVPHKKNPKSQRKYNYWLINFQSNQCSRFLVQIKRVQGRSTIIHQEQKKEKEEGR